MAKQKRPAWYVPRPETDPPYAFFISHVAEDAPDVQQLKVEIEAYSGRGGRAGLRCFLDVTTWPGGNENSEVIREALLRSEHMVPWVTRNYLNAQRGWVWLELAYSELIELSMNVENLDIRHPYLVPIFRGITVAEVERTPLLSYWQRKLLLSSDPASVREVAMMLVDFREQEAFKRASSH